MHLANGDKAIVDIRKLSDYVLNQNHIRGRHKAYVFESVLGFTAEDSEKLRTLLLRAIVSSEAKLMGEDNYGQRYQVDFAIVTEKAEANVRSAWIIRNDEDFPRFVSCYIL